MCGVSARTTAQLAPLPGPGAQILHQLWQGTTWEHDTVLTEREDIDCAYRITRAGGPTLRATVYPAVLAPLPAYGARLRGIVFWHRDGTSRLVVKACRLTALRLSPPVPEGRGPQSGWMVDRRLGDLLALVDHTAACLSPLLFRQIVFDRVGQSLIWYVSLWHVAASNLSLQPVVYLVPRA